jgi:hypothetical protein
MMESDLLGDSLMDSITVPESLELAFAEFLFDLRTNDSCSGNGSIIAHSMSGTTCGNIMSEAFAETAVYVQEGPTCTTSLQDLMHRC